MIPASKTDLEKQKVLTRIKYPNRRMINGRLVFKNQNGGKNSRQNGNQ